MSTQPKNLLDPTQTPSHIYYRSGGSLPETGVYKGDLRDGIPEELRQKMKPKVFPEKKSVLDRSS